MITYEAQPRQELGLSSDEWHDLKQFIGGIQSVIEAETRSEHIEAGPPCFTDRQSDLPTLFSPGGWVGRYPGGITVLPNPDKLNELEYQHLVREVAGWLEIWDVPTANSVLPVLQTESLERRRILLGYSNALIAFTEEAVAHRPPVAIEKQQYTGPQPQGSLDIARTIQVRASGSKSIATNKLQFSFEHPLNLLLIRFHSDLKRELADLTDQSIMTDSLIRKNQSYHQAFVAERFPNELIDQALQTDFNDPKLLDQAQHDSPHQFGELIDIWEAYQRQQALDISMQDELTIGLKPVEKIYEMWVLKIIVECLQSVLETEPTVDENMREFTFSNSISLHYNRSLREYSRLLTPGFDSNPGRPDYAVSVGDDIRWIGDAKFSPKRNIQLEDYQRLLSYTADLMRADSQSVTTILYPSDRTVSQTASTKAYTVEQIPFRPKGIDHQRRALKRQLRDSIPDQYLTDSD